MAWTEHDVVRSELRWALPVIGFVAILFALTFVAALALHRNPPSHAERINPKTLRLTGEFTEPNLGTRVEANGQITTRIVATQFAFVQNCAVVPEGREATLRLARPDVIHGILVAGTNVNTMVVPGYVSQVHTVFRTTGDLLMPCHEFCGSDTARCWRGFVSYRPISFGWTRRGGRAVVRNRGLVLPHRRGQFARSEHSAECGAKPLRDL